MDKNVDIVAGNFFLGLFLAAVLSCGVAIEYVNNWTGPVSTIALASVPLFCLINTLRSMMTNKENAEPALELTDAPLAVWFLMYFICPMVSVLMWVLSR